MGNDALNTDDTDGDGIDTAGDIPTPTGLYTTGDLLGGWRADDPLSYATTLDARVFRPRRLPACGRPPPPPSPAAVRCTTTP